MMLSTTAKYLQNAIYAKLLGGWLMVPGSMTLSFFIVRQSLPQLFRRDTYLLVYLD